ncbi:MAG: hypothetical protein Q8930_09200 [Bacillota bacterium]|nr:hypothetical protein [Bacillota bacterium]
MYYRNCGSYVGTSPIGPMMQGNICPTWQSGMCPMAQGHHNQMMQNQNMPMMQNQNMPMMQNQNMPMGMENNMGMKMEDNAPEKQIEMLYPEIYFIILPHVKHHCDKIEEKHGKMHCPHKEEMKEIVEDICKKVEKDLGEEDKKDECRDEDRRPRPYGRGRLLGDLVGILFLNELIGRRPPFYGYGYNYGYWY